MTDDPIPDFRRAPCARGPSRAVGGTSLLHQGFSLSIGELSHVRSRLSIALLIFSAPCAKVRPPHPPFAGHRICIGFIQHCEYSGKYNRIDPTPRRFGVPGAVRGRWPCHRG